MEEVDALLQEQANRVGTQVQQPLSPKRKVPRRLTFERQLEKDADRTMERTGLTEAEFNHVFDLLSQAPDPLRRGRKLLDLNIRLVIFLQWIKLGMTYKQLANSFGLSLSRVQTILSDMWNPIVEVLSNDLLPKRPYEYHSARQFDNYPNAIGALDATLIPVRKPVVASEAGTYLSGKHRKYGVRLQVLVSPDGTAIHYGGICRGRQHDFELFKSGTLARDMLTTQTRGDGTVIPMHPTILADGGYQGIAAIYPESIIPRRKPIGRERPIEDIEFNHNLSHDRIVVERFFGRLKGYWGILQRPLRVDKINIDGLLRICVCLTNLKIRNSPLYAEETIFNPDPECEEESEANETSSAYINSTQSLPSLLEDDNASPFISTVITQNTVAYVPVPRTPTDIITSEEEEEHSPMKKAKTKKRKTVGGKSQKRKE